MAQSQIPQPTLTDKLMLLPNLTLTLFSAITRALTGPLLGGPRATTYFKDIVFAALRTNLSITSAATEQWMNATTEAGYLQLAKAKGFQPETTVLEGQGGLKLYWIGPKTAKKVLLYFHGGGYVLSCSPGHYAWLYDLQQALAKDASVSVVVVGYTLAPHGQYPKQLQEAGESLRWLLETQKYAPGDIVIGGDSAGGNMATMLLLHLLHPHSAAPELKLSGPLAGAVLISPWWKFKSEDDSVERNATSDIITPQAADRWASLFLGPAPIDKWNQPYLADSAWFKGLDKVAKDILVWGGGGEVLIDSIESVGKKIKEVHSQTELVVEPGAAHEDFILDKFLGYKVATGKGGEVVENWIAQSEVDRSYLELCDMSSICRSVFVQRSLEAAMFARVDVF